MRIYNKIATEHKDVVHDICYDYYGKRLATCSSDSTIKIWDLEDGSKWINSATIRQHSGAVWRVSWAHPEFGQVIASCSFDRTVVVFEETSSGVWTVKATLVDALKEVVDVKFAPRHMGLRLAAASYDGQVRIYEAIDVMNLAHWTLMEEFEVSKIGCSCLAWNPSPFGPATIIIGTQDTEKNLHIYEYNESYRRWQHVKVLAEHSDAILDVCWSHQMGRTYHTVASSSKDQKLLLWKLLDGDDQSKYEYYAPTENLRKDKKIRMDVWRINFNMTGTMIGGSGDDGVVRLFTQNYKGEWKELIPPIASNDSQ